MLHSHDRRPQAYIKPSSSGHFENRRRFLTVRVFLWRTTVMIDVSRTPEFYNGRTLNSVAMDTTSDQSLGSVGRSRTRQRSSSDYCPENNGLQTQTEENPRRPRSRYVFTSNFKILISFLYHVFCPNTFCYWPDRNMHDNSYGLKRGMCCSPGPFIAMRHQSFSPITMTEALPGPMPGGQDPAPYSNTKRPKRTRERVMGLPLDSPPKNPSLNPSSPQYLETSMVLKSISYNGMKIWGDLEKLRMNCVFILCSFSSGSKGSLTSVSMMTISESDNWEISSTSGMKYGQFVDWEKIDPEAAERYQRILNSKHQEMKTMGREGFWAMPHTLRAKAYYHIIHGINSRCGDLTWHSWIHTELCLISHVGIL